MVGTRFDGHDRADARGQRDQPEHLIGNAFHRRALAEVRGAGAVEFAGLAERDTEILPGRDLRDALAFERFHQHGALALIELVAEAELPIAIPTPAVDVPVARQHHRVF